MRKLAVAAACLVWCFASGVRAELLGTFTTTYGESVDVNHSSSVIDVGSTSVEEHVFTIGALEGASYLAAANGGGVYGESGAFKFSVDGGSGYLILASSGFAANTVSNLVTGAESPQTYVNFDNVLSSSRSTGTTLSGLTGYKGYTYVRGNWYSRSDDELTTPDDEPLSPIYLDTGDVFAKVYTTVGAQLSLSGLFGLNNGHSAGGTFSVAVPEPGTLAMLAAGLFGLVAYAWRKRK
jgi:hypothetical protein